MWRPCRAIEDQKGMRNGPCPSSRADFPRTAMTAGISILAMSRSAPSQFALASTGPAPTSKTHGGFFYRTALKPIFRNGAISVIGPRGNRPHVIWAMTDECMLMTEQQIDAAIEKAKPEGAPANARFIPIW